jgi:hypothetical protein
VTSPLITPSDSPSNIDILFPPQIRVWIHLKSPSLETLKQESFQARNKGKTRYRV